jgi:LacI family transcriptional regulator
MIVLKLVNKQKLKLKKYAKLKNYKPNVIGLNLKNRRTKMGDYLFLNSFFAKVLVVLKKWQMKRDTM